MKNGTVLIVDSESSIRHALQVDLHAFGFNTAEAANHRDAISMARKNHFDAILLDIDPPGLSGIETCKKMRSLFPRTPILTISARDSEDAKVTALDAGADDYITKPFGVRELAARIRALMRWLQRYGQPKQLDEPPLQIGQIQIDHTRGTVKKAGRIVHLTPKEYELTHYLMSQAGRPIPYTQLLGRVWGPGYEQELEYLRTFMYQLRKKLEDDPARPQYLLTVFNIGYRFAEKE